MIINDIDNNISAALRANDLQLITIISITRRITRIITRIYSIVGQKTAPALINIRTFLTGVSSGEQGEGYTVSGPFFMPLFEPLFAAVHHTHMPFALSSSSIRIQVMRLQVRPFRLGY